MSTRDQRFWPQLSGLGRALDSLMTLTTDRGLTGPAARDADDVRDRLDKRQAKLARRAARAAMAAAPAQKPAPGPAPDFQKWSPLLCECRGYGPTCTYCRGFGVRP